MKVRDCFTPCKLILWFSMWFCWDVILEIKTLEQEAWYSQMKQKDISQESWCQWRISFGKLTSKWIFVEISYSQPPLVSMIPIKIHTILIIQIDEGCHCYLQELHPSDNHIKLRTFSLVHWWFCLWICCSLLCQL